VTTELRPETIQILGGPRQLTGHRNEFIKHASAILQAAVANCELIYSKQKDRLAAVSPKFDPVF